MPYGPEGEYESLDEYYDATRKPNKGMKIQAWRDAKSEESRKNNALARARRHAERYGQETNEEGDIQTPTEVVWDTRSTQFNKRLLHFEHGCGTCGCGNGGNCGQ